MRIAYITAGAAGMYCGSCIHDNTLAVALQRQGHEVALVPTYTPIRTDEASTSIDRVFLGALNVYLQQKLSLFRHTPRALDWLLDRPALLRWVSRLATSTDSRELGALTLSVLQGEDGRQIKELRRLVAWLGDSFRPQVVHLTNSMFLGVGRMIRRQLGVPVVCSLQGEDLFLEDLVEPFRKEALRLLRDLSSEVDGFIAPSRYYADFMSSYLGIPPARCHVVSLGISLDGYREPKPRAADSPFTVGYLARICPEKGLHILVEAFRLLAEWESAERVRLRVAGYLGARDRAYFEKLENKIEAWGLSPCFDAVGEVDRLEKLRFLETLDVLAVPTVYREPKGLFALEAMASGVPVVLPRHGSFPELVDATGGGLLVEPESPHAVAEGLAQLMRDAELRRELGRSSRAAVYRGFSDVAMAEATLEVYRRVLAGADSA